MDDLGALTTEQRNPASTGIDTRSTAEILHIINDEGAKVAAAVRAAIPQIAGVVEAVTASLKAGGRGESCRPDAFYPPRARMTSSMPASCFRSPARVSRT